MKTCRVSVTGGARRDLTDIYRYLQNEESPQAARDWLGRLGALAASLASTPERGPIPRELEDLGIREYRQVLVGPYRLIYRVVDAAVFIMGWPMAAAT
jgi:toxin ParE1/3/4